LRASSQCAFRIRYMAQSQELRSGPKKQDTSIVST
jgi:hypothetical protein